MVNKASNKGKKSYEASSLSARGVIGLILMLVGGIAAIALLFGVEGAFFGALRPMLNGVAGCFAILLVALVIWCGYLVMRSATRKVSFRSLLFATAIYLFFLGLITLLSRVGENGFFVDYCIAARKHSPDADSFQSVMQVAYQFCSRAGEPAGVLGAMVAYPLRKLLGVGGGAFVLIVLLIGAVLWLLRFNVGQRLEEVKTFIANWKQKSALRREQQEQQQRLWEQQVEQDPQQLQQPNYRRSFGFNKQKAAAQAMFAQQSMNVQTVPQEMPVQEVPVAAAQQQMLWPAPNPELQLYDEVIDKAAITPAKTTDKTVTEQDPIRQQRKTIDRFEEMRKRKAELTNRFGHVDKPAPREGTSLVEKATAAKEEAKERLENDLQPIVTEEIETPVPVETETEPVPEVQPEGDAEPIVFAEEEYHPLEGLDTEDDEEEEPENEPPRMPESTTMHTPQFAPLVGMEQFMPLVDDDDEEDPELLIAEEEPEPPKPYVFPPVDLLNLEQYRVPDTHEADQERAQKLVETLSSFGIPAKVQHVTHGPAITRFAMGLTASGINVKRIQNIADNIALDLAADGAIRIESQIPGTNLFGIEVPNKEIQTVTFAQVLLSPEMQSATSPLAVGLGHDITGKPIICDLCKMPHLLIAGQTGSGKSVCVNTIINSLLFRASPEDVRMIMIDPKVVELQSYNVVPHLLIPVVTDPHKAAGALAWAVAEMEDRYKKMLTKNVRELSAYNAKLEPGEPKLPRIVIIIDELADLMMASKHDVEESIIRLAQKARAAGIHMVVATQRPTVDVITGLIKSNVPSRIAFAVSSTVDSRTILDKVGAEKLLGRGDMLYMPTGCKAPVRVQGCFLSDAEIERIVSYIEENSKVEFDPDVMEALEKQEDDGSDALDDGGSDDGVDDRLQEAIEMVVTDGQASISMLQRRMKVGYARAGRLIDDMAARGIVSKSLGSKPREVLITREEYDRIKDALFDE